MKAPPQQIDGARVLKHAALAGHPATCKTRHFVRDHQVTNFAGLAIASYDDGLGVYLFYCDTEWRVVTDTFHDSAEAAITQAKSEFGEVKFFER